MKQTRTAHKGIFYFATRPDALTYANQHQHPTSRIIAYERGYAIQLRKSGPYVGPTVAAEQRQAMIDWAAHDDGIMTPDEYWHPDTQE